MSGSTGTAHKIHNRTTRFQYRLPAFKAPRGYHRISMKAGPYKAKGKDATEITRVYACL